MFRSPFATIIGPIYTMCAFDARTVWDPIVLQTAFVKKMLLKIFTILDKIPYDIKYINCACKING
jgi:hypothetical protein